MRPRDLVVTAFRQLCRSLDVERILAVSDETRVCSDPYFASHAAVFASYDTVWWQNGGTPAVDAAAGAHPEAGFFELSVVLVRHAEAEIPSRKRAQYRRRYAMLDGLATQVDAAVGRNSKRPVSRRARCDAATLTRAPRCSAEYRSQYAAGAGRPGQAE